MVVAYLLTLACLAILSVYSSRKAASLGNAYQAADKDTRDALTPAIPNGRPDPLADARNRRKVDAAVSRLQLLEERYLKWQSRADLLKSGVSGLLSYRGKISPYILGAVDTSSTLATLKYFGINALDLLSKSF